MQTVLCKINKNWLSLKRLTLDKPRSTSLNVKNISRRQAAFCLWSRASRREGFHRKMNSQGRQDERCEIHRGLTHRQHVGLFMTRRHKWIPTVWWTSIMKWNHIYKALKNNHGWPKCCAIEQKHIQRNREAALQILKALSWKVSRQIHSCTKDRRVP